MPEPNASQESRNRRVGGGEGGREGLHSRSEGVARTSSIADQLPTSVRGEGWAEAAGAVTI